LHMLGQWTAMRLSNRWPSRRSVGKGFRCTADECALLCSIFGTDVRDQVLSCWREWLQLRRLINGVCRFIASLTITFRSINSAQNCQHPDSCRCGTTALPSVLIPSPKCKVLRVLERFCGSWSDSAGPGVILRVLKRFCGSWSEASVAHPKQTGSGRLGKAYHRWKEMGVHDMLVVAPGTCCSETIELQYESRP
jgi:hypothetical protein